MLFTNHWLIMDMDGTITPTPTSAGGQYLDLTHSPCYGPLVSFIEQGGSVCAVSTAGRRMWRQLFDVLKPTLFPNRQSTDDGDEGKGKKNNDDNSSTTAQVGKLMICGFSGAALFSSDATVGRMVEDLDYRETALLVQQDIKKEKKEEEEEEKKGHRHGGENRGGGGSTCLRAEIVPLAQALCLELLDKVFHLAMIDPTYIKQLSAKYHDPFTALTHLRRTDPTRFALDVMTSASLMEHGKYLTTTNDAILDCQWIPDTSPPVIVQFSVLGVPMARYAEIFDDAVIEKFAGLGLYCKKQPNSVVIGPHGVDKATCVSWLMRNEASFSLDRAIAFGDVPASIDKPLTLFPPMPFVSLSLSPEQDPAGVIFVGEEERGTARFLTAMMERGQARGTANFTREELMICAAMSKGD